MTFSSIFWNSRQYLHKSKERMHESMIIIFIRNTLLQKSEANMMINNEFFKFWGKPMTYLNNVNQPQFAERSIKMLSAGGRAEMW